MTDLRPGPTNSLIDVAGIRVGHADRRGSGWLSGTTVVLAPDGVMQRLFEAGVGYLIDGPGEVVPIVPGAVIFDLGRGGDFTQHPGAAMGREAYDAALSTTSGPPLMGVVGAGTGAIAGGLKGAVGSASVVLADGTTVAALATTIGVVATDAILTKAQCAKVSGIAHDGMARAIRPVHTMFDGDTVFTLATGDRGAPDPLAFHALLDAAGDCFTRAIGRAMLAAESVKTPAGLRRSYRDAFPSALPTNSSTDGP